MGNPLTRVIWTSFQSFRVRFSIEAQPCTKQLKSSFHSPCELSFVFSLGGRTIRYDDFQMGFSKIYRTLTRRVPWPLVAIVNFLMSRFLMEPMASKIS